MSGKIYPVQYNDCCNFVAGRASTGEQVLMGVVGKAPFHVVAAFFNRAGLLLREERRCVPFVDKEGLPYEPEFQNLAAELWRVLNGWKTEIGLEPSEIRIRKFHLPAWDSWGDGIGLFEVPSGMQFFADDPSSEPDEIRRRKLLADIEDFKKEGRFVLCWGTEYRMSKEGSITDT